MKYKVKQYMSMVLILLMTISLWGCGVTNTAPVAQNPAVQDALLEEISDASEQEIPSSEERGQGPFTPTPEITAIPTPETTTEIDESGWYYSAEDVGLFLHVYGRLPDNFISKEDAGELGWTGGTVEKFIPGYAIGGSKFGNREGLLPKADGRQYYECDIDTNGGKSRGAKRIVYSNDGLIYYTEDHYESFTLLYGEE